MKKYVITLDTGTTNSRAILWGDNNEIIATSFLPVGVRNTAIDGNNEKLKEAVKECLQDVLRKASITFDDVRIIIASGMITSDVGLAEIPHVKAPASAEDLARNIKSVSIKEVAPIPIHFIPGIKNDADTSDINKYEQMDIMRGEEVESVALIDEFFDGNPMLIVLPGSHMKFISVDKDKKIRGCITTISGELLSSIINHTIIADAVGRQYVSEENYDREMLVLGYQNSSKVGLTRCCFSARILRLFYVENREKISSYVLGAVLAEDIKAVKNSSALEVDSNTKIIVSGKNPFRQAMFDVFKEEGSFSDVKMIETEQQKPLSAIGAYKIAGIRNIL